MIVDNERLDDQIDEQLLRLGEHRERQADLASMGHASVRPIERTVGRMPILAAAAAALLLFGSGVYLALRADGNSGLVDTVGEADIATEGGVDADGDAETIERSEGKGLFAGPIGSFPDRAESEGDPGTARGRLVEDETGEDETGADIGGGDDTADPVAPSTTNNDSDASDGSEPVEETQEPADTDTDDPALQDVAAAGAALSDSTALMVELTSGLAGSGADTTDESPNLGGTRQGQEQLANDVAAGAANNQPSCANTELNGDLSISIRFVNCPADDGRPVNGTLVASVKRWLPLELAVVVDEMTVGADRLWLNANLTFPTRNGVLEPLLSLEILTESAGVATHVEGTARFLQGRTVLNGKLGYVTDTEVTASDTVVYRPGQTVVAANFVDVSVVEGSCAPSSGRADYQAFTVAGVRGGGGETDIVGLVDFTEEVVANVTYRPTTPADGKVTLRSGGEQVDFPLLAPCP